MIRVWAKDSPFGTELADVTITGSKLAGTGIAIGTDPAPYRLEYELTTAERFVTERLRVSARGDGWRRRWTPGRPRVRGHARPRPRVSSPASPRQPAPGSDVVAWLTRSTATSGYHRSPTRCPCYVIGSTRAAGRSPSLWRGCQFRFVDAPGAPALHIRPQ